MVYLIQMVDILAKDISLSNNYPYICKKERDMKAKVTRILVDFIKDRMIELSTEFREAFFLS